jgi:O-antigen ligase
MQGTIAYLDQRISHLVAAWIVMIPLLYFASQGNLWFHNADGTDTLGGFGSLQSAPRTAQYAAEFSIVFVVVVLLLFPKIKSVIHASRDNPVIVMLAALATISSLWSQIPIKSLEWSICLLVNTLFAFYLCRRFNTEQQMRLLLLFGWICLVSSIILALFYPQYGIFNAGGIEAWKGIYFHKNICSMMTILLLSPVFFASTISWFAKVLRIIYVVLSIFLVLMTQSATGQIALACLVICVIAVTIIGRCGRRDRVFILLFGTVTGLALVIAGFSHSTELTYLFGKDPTLTGRTGIWEAAIASVMKHPILGYGYMAFWRGLNGESANASLMNGWAVSSSHNGFLAVWLTLGAVGVGLVTYCVLKAFRDIYMCIKASATSAWKWYACIIFLTMIINLDEEQIMVPNDLTWILFILACVGLSEEARKIRGALNHG